VRHRSLEAGAAVEVIATQSELSALVSVLRRGEDGDGGRVTRGWLRERVGEELTELAAGRRALRVDERRPADDADLRVGREDCPPFGLAR
jgi:hypothetical protein